MPADSIHIRTAVVVDEHVEYREILLDLIASMPGLRVLASGVNGNDAVQLCARYVPDFLLLDAGIPRFGVRRVAVSVKQVSPNTRVILLTAADARQLRLENSPFPVERVVSKSDIRDELISLLAESSG